MIDILERKGDRVIAKAVHLWKVNIYKMRLHDIEVRLEHLDEYEEDMKDEIRERRELIANEVGRVNFKRLVNNAFMAFKQVWQQTKTNKKKIKPMLERRN